MKPRNILLAFGCVAALTACTNNDEPAMAPAMRTVTMSVTVDESADTRVAYTANSDETVFQLAWSEGDKLRVFYNDGEEKYTDFEIDATSINGKKADFTGTLPTGVTSVTISFDPYFNYVGDNRNTVIIGSTYTDEESDLSKALATMTYLYAEAVAVTEDGKLPDVKLKHAAAYLLLKKGLKVTDAGEVSSVTTTYLGFKGIGANYINFTSAEMALQLYSNQRATILYDSEGKLTKDYLVALALKEETTCELEVRYASSVGGEWSYGDWVKQASHTFKPGVIYEVSADTEWEIAPAPTE